MKRIIMIIVALAILCSCDSLPYSAYEYIIEVQSAVNTDISVRWYSDDPDIYLDYTGNFLVWRKANSYTLELEIQISSPAPVTFNFKKNGRTVHSETGTTINFLIESEYL